MIAFTDSRCAWLSTPSPALLHWWRPCETLLGFLHRLSFMNARVIPLGVPVASVQETSIHASKSKAVEQNAGLRPHMSWRKRRDFFRRLALNFMRKRGFLSHPLVLTLRPKTVGHSWNELKNTMAYKGSTFFAPFLRGSPVSLLSYLLNPIRPQRPVL